MIRKHRGKTPIKKAAAMLAAAALVGVGSATVLAGPAFAHTPKVDAQCYALNVNLTDYRTKPATTKQVVDVPEHTEVIKEAWVETVTDSPAIPGKPAVPAQDAVYGDAPLISPAVPAQDAVPATYVQEYEFRQHITGKTRWETDPNWNAGPKGKGWSATGKQRDTATVFTPAKPAVPAQDAVYGERPLITPAVPAQDAIPEVPAVTHTVEHAAVTKVVPATYKTVEDQPADSTPNLVQIRLGSGVAKSFEFGTEFSKSFDIADFTKGESYAVNVVAWDDKDKSHGWTKYFYGTTPTCANYVQDYINCDYGAFVLDNNGVGRDVNFEVNGETFTVPANSVLHTDANGKKIKPVNGEYVISTANQSWTFHSKEGTPECTTPVTPEPTTPTPTDEPTGEPSTPTPTDEPSGEPSTPAPTDEPTGTPTPTPTDEPSTPKVVAPLPPTFNDLCDTDKDDYALPKDTEAVTYTVDDHTTSEGVRTVTVIAQAEDGYILEDVTDNNAKVQRITWEYQYTNEPCDTGTTPPPTGEPTPPVTTPPTDNTPAPTCDTVGAVNIPKTSPLYNTALDSDKDGVACESTTPTVDKTPAAAPPAKAPAHTQGKAATTGQLAYTGSEGLLGVLVIALVLFAAGVWITVDRQIRNRKP